jgi:uncharacterized cupin superfamily protein
MILRAADIRRKEESHSHPWNPASEIHGARLAHDAGLRRIGVNIARIPPGKESFVYHRHHVEEEWLYILSGRAAIELDGTEHEVGPGDFVAFPPGVAHHVRNPFAEDVTYLMGGESVDVEIADFPKLGKRMVRHGMKTAVYPLEAEALGAYPKL